MDAEVMGDSPCLLNGDMLQPARWLALGGTGGCSHNRAEAVLLRESAHVP